MKTQTKKIEDLWPGDRVVFQSRSYRFSHASKNSFDYVVLSLDSQHGSPGWGLMLTGDWSTSVEVEV